MSRRQRNDERGNGVESKPSGLTLAGGGGVEGRGKGGGATPVRWTSFDTGDPTVQSRTRAGQEGREETLRSVDCRSSARV